MELKHPHSAHDGVQKSQRNQVSHLIDSVDEYINEKPGFIEIFGATVVNEKVWTVVTRTQVQTFNSDQQLTSRGDSC